MKQKLRFLMLTLLCAVFSTAWATEVTDVLNRALTGVTSGTTTYSNWSGKKSNSDAVYAGNSAGGNNSIQLRSSNSSSGIVTTTSGGKVKKVIITWNASTTTSRKLSVYGKNSAYSAATDLYNSNNRGTLLGTIDYSTNPTELTITDDYEYIGLRSSDGAMYLSEIQIIWETTSSTPTVATPTFSLGGGEYTETKSVEITCSTTGASIYYTTDNTTPSATNGTLYSSAITINETTTLKAIAIKDNVSSAMAEATYTIVAPYTVVDGVFNFNEYGYGMTQNNSGYNPNGTTLVAGNVSILLDGSSASRYYLTTTPSYELRTYTSCKMTISVPLGKEITKVEFDLNTPASRIKYDGNAIQQGDVNTKGVWEGQKREVVFTFSDRSDIQKITVTCVDAPPTLAVAPYETTVAIGGGTGTLAIVPINIDMSNVGTALFSYFDSEGNSLGESPSWLHLTKSDDKKAINYIVDSNDGAPRTAYFKVYYTFMNGQNPIWSDMATINQEGRFVVEDGIFNFEEYNYGMEATQDNEVYNPNPTTLEAVNVSIELTGENASRYWQTTTPSYELRTYTSCTMTISVPTGKVITKVEFDLNSPASRILYNGNPLGGSETNATWVGLGNPVVFTFSGSSYIQNITVTYGDAPLVALDPNTPNPVIIPYTGTVSTDENRVYITDNGCADIGIQFYDADEKPLQSAPSWLDSNPAHWDDEDVKNIIIIDASSNVMYRFGENDGAARTVYLKVWGTTEPNAPETERVYTDMITITQQAYVAPVTTKTYVKVTSTDDITDGNYLIVYEEGSVAFNGSLETLDAANNNKSVVLNNGTITTPDEIYFTINTTDKTIKSASGYYIGRTGDSNGLNYNATTTYTNTISIDNDNNAVIKSSGGAYMRFNSSTNASQFRYYKSSTYTGQKPIQLYKEVKDEFTFTFQEAATDGTDHYATISALGNKYFKVPAGLKVYCVTVNENKLDPSDPFEENDIIKDGAYLVCGKPGTYTFTAVYPTQDEIAAIANPENMLVSTGENGVTESEMEAAYPESGYKFYKLALHKKTKKVGFLWGAENGAAFKYNTGHQAYLPVPTTSTGSSVSAYYFDDTTDVTGISDVQAEAVTTNDVYTFSGVRVSGTALPKGIYIVNGNKVVIK